MIKEDIRIKKVIVHILDSMVGLPVLSDKEIEFGSDFADFCGNIFIRLQAVMTVRHVAFMKKNQKFSRW